MSRKFKKPYKGRFASRKDYSHEKTFGAAPFVSLPRELLNLTPILNQGSLPHCTAYASVAMRRAMTGKEYDPEAQWRLELQHEGVPDAPGFELDVPARVGRDMGFVPVGQTEPTDKVGGYFWVNQRMPGMDWFDTIRRTQFQLYQRYGKIIPFQIGINWYADWDNTPNGIIPDSQIQLLGGHDTLLGGFQTYNIDNVEYVVNQGSWGEGFGDQGLFRFNRAQTNKNIGGFGIFYWLEIADMPPDVVRLGIIAQIFQNIKAIYQILVNYKKTLPPVPEPPIIPPADDIPPPAPTTPQAPTNFLWDTHDNAKHSVRVICDQEGLSFSMKNDLCACIEVESGFALDVVHQNKNPYGQVTSTDYGIVQVNDFFHIGPGKDFPTPSFVIQNPEKCVRWMARLFKAGKADLWSSYKSGAYKRFL